MVVYKKEIREAREVEAESFVVEKPDEQILLCLKVKAAVRIENVEHRLEPAWMHQAGPIYPSSCHRSGTW